MSYPAYLHDYVSNRLEVVAEFDTLTKLKAMADAMVNREILHDDAEHLQLVIYTENEFFDDDLATLQRTAQHIQQENQA